MMGHTSNQSDSLDPTAFVLQHARWAREGDPRHLDKVVGARSPDEVLSSASGRLER